MKILWITNTLFPDICKDLGLPISFVGGWMYSGAKNILNIDKNINLAVASIYRGKEFKSKEINGITYFLIPRKASNNKYQSHLERHWIYIKKLFRPELIHIHGTEYPHGLAYVKACGNNGVITSVQGLVSIYERYYYGGIDEKVLRKNITLRDRIRLDSVFSQKEAMKQRGKYEIELIHSIKHIIGRTTWDKTHVWAINPEVNYHFCNETLRDEFYNKNWCLENCEKHSIFLSQAYYPIKGLQQMISAMPIILRHYPDVKIYIAGNDFITNRGWRLNGYGKYISKLITQYGINSHVIFTGTLSEKEMRDRYLKSHIFVCPSSIENSSNSIGEAQLLGVPCVASYVGGTPDLVKEDETGLLYRFEDFEMLAAAVCRLLRDDNLAKYLSIQAKKAASSRHDKMRNALQLYSIYKKICNGS